MPQEKIVPLNTDHDRLCQLTAVVGQVHHDIADWFGKVTGSAYQTVMNRIRPSKYILLIVPHVKGGKRMVRNLLVVFTDQS